MDALKASPTKTAKARQEIESIVKNDRFFLEKEHLTNKAINLSFITRLHQERKEAVTEAACANAKVSQGWRVEEVKQEDILAREIMKDKCQASIDMKKSILMRHTEELRELQQKLKSAYLRKDLAIQLAEKRSRELRLKSQEQDEAMKMVEQEKFLQDFDNQTKLEENQKKLKYKEELQDQMIDRQKMREEYYRNLLLDKSFIDESLRTVYEEDKKEEELKKIRKQIAKEEALKMLQAKKLWVEKEKIYQEEEDRKIREYLEEKRKLEKEFQESNKKKEEIRLQKRIACVNMIHSTEGERLERQRIAEILLDEDSRQKALEKERQELEKKIRTASEYKQITAKQMEDRLRRMEADKMDDIKFSQQLLEENRRAMLCEKEQMALKHQENLEYGKSLKSIMNQHRINKLQQMDEEYQQYIYNLEEMNRRREIIDEERLKLLKEHVGNLIGYIGKGVIYEEDLPHLDPEVRKFYEGSK